jgi:6-phosphogluconolactonase
MSLLGFVCGAGLPVFDVILLGTGPDGHVASLFPNWPQTAALEGLVLPISGSPKPPPERITFTMPVINRCGALQGHAS